MAELKKILHVEDDAEILQITGMALNLVGDFDIMQVDRGDKALAVIEEFQPQLILSDVQMPGLTGPETLVEIRKMAGFENVPCIYLTARLMDGGEGLIVHPADLDVIGKPFDPMTLADQINEIWATKYEAAA
ncbi:response regulator [Sulfitobacter mediterraneus]|jgi:CheY-like chemotaxis protein|uniref:Chemotaxis protein CheY n=1 Tax=Sulfitobacter mediterraneus TaxID=83219 RepID=A0A061SRK9_9RHOB|nr:response regulator [Sulfitobacter mediterraneus]KAJ02049.1 chemotaxis protein CheY [Sulfitobacter mediterraneus]MBM1312081.1 response regulator [Sulfitobacter mediterraneus]MBM1315961.1 response regulator [Sulfitobacter mediterraneus]MBM1324324.1 response regulator [Sulfitobacter mediterraneus]MBM1328235.1 response regulator [Sulfitobacter mediterraneus]